MDIQDAYNFCMDVDEKAGDRGPILVSWKYALSF